MQERTVDRSGVAVNDPARFRHRVRLHAPSVGEHEVLFSWQVTPETELYHRSEFTLRFPETIELARIPEDVWWLVMLICLHTHWALLRPCLVELPVRIGAGEREFWMRMAENVTAQLEAYGSTPYRGGRPVVLTESGPVVAPALASPAGGERPTRPGRSVVAFSGGKDSLVLAALAAELTERPVLVTITSPVPWAPRDHVGGARERALATIAARLAVDTIEVHSDFRTAWELTFAARDGCVLGVHELSDLPLYYGAITAVAAAIGGGRCMLASEADIQYNAPGDGWPVLHRDLLSGAAVQRALNAVLGRHGVGQGSLSYPLHMPQVLGLLLRRYPQLFELVFSCWQAPAGKQACGRCDKCFQIAVVALAEGVSPWVAGIDPVEALCAYADFRVAAVSNRVRTAPDQRRFAGHHIIRGLRCTPTARVAAMLDSDARSRDDERRGEALAIWARLRADALAVTVPSAPGYVTSFLELVPLDVREPLRAVLAEHFGPTDEPELAAMAARSRALTARLTAPLGPVAGGD
jgi:hypothetical protein